MAIVSLLVLASIVKKIKKENHSNAKENLLRNKISLWKFIKFISKIKDEWERMIIYD